MSASLLAFILVSGCYSYYKANTITFPQPGAVVPLTDMRKTIVVHCKDKVSVFNNIIIENDSLKGRYAADYILPYKKSTFPLENSTNRYVKKRGDARILNEVHLYIQNVNTTLFPGYTSVSFALKDITRLDIYNPDSGRTIISWIVGMMLGVLGAYAALFIIIIIAAIAGGGSCPYIYTNNGNGYTFAGEIYSGAVYAPLERNDYLVLPNLVIEKGTYKLKISNELYEIQNTNLTELYVIDHQEKSQVLFDKYGNYQTSVDQRSPVTATNLIGTDVLNLVTAKDSISYCGMPPGNELPLTDGLELTFNHPDGINSGKIFIRARNSIWLDYVYKSSHDLFGNYYGRWVKKQKKSDSKELQDWSLSQKIPLSVYVEKNGKWVFCDYYNMAGPMAFKDDVVAIDLKGIESGPLKIKLESGSYFWEIDYVGVDYSINIPVGFNKVLLDKAITYNENPVTELLKFDDVKYFRQTEINSYADLSFTAPPLTNGERTVILHSKGYYEILNDVKGLPKINKLKEIHKPGQFLEYSRALMKDRLENYMRNR